MPAHRNRKLGCSCCASNGAGWVNRRRFLQFSAATLTLLPSAVRADDKPIDVLLLICNDRRVWQPSINFMNAREMQGGYRSFAIEGGAIGLVAEQFRDAPLRKKFWDDLDSAVTWNGMQKIVALDHRDCDAAAAAYGLAKISDRLLETEMHRYALNEFRNRVAARHADVEVEIGLMALDGKVQMLR